VQPAGGRKSRSTPNGDRAGPVGLPGRLRKRRCIVPVDGFSGSASAAARSLVGAQYPPASRYPEGHRPTHCGTRVSEYQAQAALKAAGARTLNTGGGKVVGIDGPPPPTRVVINEWDSLDQATTYYKSKAWNDLAPQREKAIKTVRRYAVEAVR
jgi:uncharacterized protein (DUF1330 family)